MSRSVSRSVKFLIAASLLVSCSARMPPAAVRWNEAAQVLAPPPDATVNEGTDLGYLRVETDTDVRVSGSLSYNNVRRPFDVYSSDGTLLHPDVNNQGWRNGEEPASLALPPGRYVVASMYGTAYRKLQVEVRAGTTTEVPANALREAPRVFPN